MNKIFWNNLLLHILLNVTDHFKSVKLCQLIANNAFLTGARRHIATELRNLRVATNGRLNAQVQK